MGFFSLFVSIFLYFHLMSFLSHGLLLAVPQPLCEQWLKSKPQLAKQLSLKVFPDSKDSEKFKLFYWTSTEFNPHWPTLVFIPGGPGQTFHQLEWTPIPGINFLYFDPRGSGCSADLSEEIKNSPAFYSSELVVADLLALQQQLKIKSWSIYGHSYGTIPATIFSSQHPTLVHKLFLEGTLINGKKSYWQSAARAEILEKVLRLLPEAQQKTILSHFTEYPEKSYWFSQLLQERLAYGLNKEKLSLEISRRLKREMKADFSAQKLHENLPYFSKNFYTQISCQELSMAEVSVSRLYLYQHQKFVFYNPDDFQNLCAPIVFTPKTYDHTNFPLNVPTFYFQGEFDYQTPTQDAFLHYQNNLSVQKKFFILKNEGHNALRFLLSTSDQNKIFEGLNFRDFLLHELTAD